MTKVRAELTAHVGGAPSATQRALIDRTAMLALRVALLDAKALAGNGLMNELDTRTYLAWSNSLGRALRELGLKSVTSAPADLQTYLRRRGS